MGTRSSISGTYKNPNKGTYMLQIVEREIRFSVVQHCVHQTINQPPPVSGDNRKRLLRCSEVDRSMFQQGRPVCQYLGGYEPLQMGGYIPGSI